MKTLSTLGVVVVLAPMLLVNGPATAGDAQTPQAAPKAASMSGDAAAALKQDMRKLWTDHVVWTRDYIVAAVGDQPDARPPSAVDEEPGRHRQGRRKYYGRPPAQLTTLLKEHITIAVDVIKDAKAGDNAALKQRTPNGTERRRHRNFLSKANPIGRGPPWST